MVYVVTIILISSFTGYLITHFLDLSPAICKSNNSSCNIDTFRTTPLTLIERVVYGVVLGVGLFTWMAYLFSLSWGLQYKSIYFSIVILIVFCSWFLITKCTLFKTRIFHDFVALRDAFFLNKFSFSVHIVVFCFFATIFCRLFYRTIIWHDGAMYIGLPNNYGDLPLHLSYITSFVWGDNIPPQNPSFAGEKLSYPILSDFLSAVFLKCGLDFKNILFIPGFLLTVVLYGVLYFFVYRLTKKRVVALVSAFMFFFSGGFGFFYFLQKISESQGSVWHLLSHLPQDFTKITSLNYHWITPLSCLNVPQRALLFGFPITILIFTILYKGLESKIEEGFNENSDGLKKSNYLKVGPFKFAKNGTKTWKLFLFAGVVAGTLPFFHTHSFMAMLMVTIPLGIIFWDWRNWFFFFFPAFILSLPQIITLSTNVGGGSFFKFHFGWMSDKENFFWFWLKNVGIYWIVFIAGLVAVFVFKKGTLKFSQTTKLFGGGKSFFLVRKKEYTPIYFSLTFLLLFLLSNFILFAPSKWDNIKILIYWFIGSLPIAAIGLSALYECKSYKIFTRGLFFIVMFFLVFSGGLDVYRYAVAPIYGWQEFTKEEVELAKTISAETEPEAVFLNAPIFNHVVFIAGRKALMGYPGHIWSHGYTDYRKRENDIKKMLKGKPGAVSLIEEYKLYYAILGHHERRIGADKLFFDINYESIITTDTYTVYDLHKKRVFGAVNSSDIGFNKNENGSVQSRGLPVRYYANATWKGDVVYKEMFNEVDFNWSSEGVKPLRSPFSAILEGYIDVYDTGLYTFKIISDDGSWLYIDGNLIIDNGGSHATRTKSGSVTMSKGKHRIMIKYFDGGGGAVLQLRWTTPGGEERKVPNGNLSF